jgi:N-acetylglucosaminyldiphosphoundecaprenol N-acetyl-beta-D-mannosaminyltransferase
MPLEGRTPGVAPRDRIEVLGVPVDVLSVPDLLSRLSAVMATDGRATILHANAHAMNLAARHAWFNRALADAELVLCDGSGIQLAARWLGQRVPSRITYADWFWDLASCCEQWGTGLYLLGAKPGVAAEAAARAAARHPRLRIAGTAHGFFDHTAGSADSRARIAAINAARPGILIVGFGMPLQERWIAAHRDALEVPVVLSGGAVFDYVSGRLRRAPRWMTAHGLEWLGRLAIEPRRLAVRYLLGNPLFLSRVIRARFTARRGR